MAEQHLEAAVPTHTYNSKQCWLRRAVSYILTHCWELPANILETTALVLVVFVQDIWFKQCVALTAALLTVSFVLHGLAYRAGQCQLGSILLGRNFIREYYHDLNPKAVWDTPLIEHCALVVGVNWVICQTIMGLAQVFVIVFGISIDKDVISAVMMCYVMQLLPLIWALAFTLMYPWRIKRRWGYVYGVRQSCHPPNARNASVKAAAGGWDAAPATVGDSNNTGSDAGTKLLGGLRSGLNSSPSSSCGLVDHGLLRQWQWLLLS
eukprot:gene6880-7096_t